MKKPKSLENAKDGVVALLGKRVCVRQNRGRNKIHSFYGKLSEVHPNVFVIEVENGIVDRISCSYADVVCGEILLKEKPV